MSTGLVICSTCQREVHQHGWRPPSQTAIWKHCEDGTELCAGASVVYPAHRTDIKGTFCEADGKAPK